MITWPDELVFDIARRKSVLYLGSGVSASAISSDGSNRHPATWNEFLSGILIKKSHDLFDEKDTITKLLDAKEYLAACEIIVDTLGDQAFGELAADEFRRPGYEPSKVHETIFSLDSRIVITPNIDKIYEQCAATNSHGTVVVKKYYEDIAPFLRQADYLVIKAHGCVDDPQHIVFTHKQYNVAQYKYATFYRLLDALLLTNTFVFIGCGLTDPDIQLTLENCNFSFPNCKPHYFITAEGSIPNGIIKSLSTNRNIKVITYSNASGKHEELLNELSSLCALVEAKRVEISSNATW